MMDEPLDVVTRMDSMKNGNTGIDYVREKNGIVSISKVNVNRKRPTREYLPDNRMVDDQYSKGYGREIDRIDETIKNDEQKYGH